MALFGPLEGDVTVLLLLFISTGDVSTDIAAASAQRAPLPEVDEEEMELILSWVLLSVLEVDTELVESSSVVSRRPVSSLGRESDLRAICRPEMKTNIDVKKDDY